MVTRIPDRDLRLGQLAWRIRADFEESSGAPRAEQQYAEGINPPKTAEGASTQWLVATTLRLALRQYDEAAADWRKASRWGAIAHRLLVETAGVERAARSVHSFLAYALVAGEADTVAQLLAPHDPRDGQGHPWGRVLIALAAGDENVTRAEAAAYDRQFPVEAAAKRRALSHLGAAAVAVLDGDAGAFAAALDDVLAALEAAVRRGYLKGQTAALLSVEAAVLWRLAVDRGLTVAVDEHYHAVPSRFKVASELDFEGEPARGQSFLWPVDLLPVGFLERVAAMEGAAAGLDPLRVPIHPARLEGGPGAGRDRHDA